ncbi:MAG: response regulator [Burkholderiaceae bacterium]|nr:response regulator [Burkholderiaceae bacterium]
MRVAMLQPHDAVTLSLLGGDGLQAGSQLMVIDDDPLALQLMCNMLERLQMRVDCQPDGRRALRELEERLTDAIILDLVMPDFDGFAVLDALRADERLRHLPVFLRTNMVLSEIDIQAPKIDGLTAAPDQGRPGHGQGGGGGLHRLCDEGRRDEDAGRRL